jgi:hypothetical protein
VSTNRVYCTLIWPRRTDWWVMAVRSREYTAVVASDGRHRVLLPVLFDPDAA